MSTCAAAAKINSIGKQIADLPSIDNRCRHTILCIALTGPAFLVDNEQIIRYQIGLEKA
jgi:hypothetical protein